jgi:hypothetical protein
MDQYLSTVIITLITGIFSIVTLVIQKKQDDVINKIDSQTSFIEKEKVLKQRLTKKQAEQEELIHNIMLLILDTNLHILKNTMIAGAIVPDESVFQKSDYIKTHFKELNDEIQDISKEYEMLLDLTKDLQQPKK